MTELTPEVLRDARFREGWRGYNPADVDEFIDQVSTGVQALHDRIRDLTLRAERAENRSVGDNDETVKRTLVLAQKAADLVVSEAKTVAERVVADAHRDAERVIADAEANAEARRRQLTEDADRAAADRSQQLESDHRDALTRLDAERQVAERETVRVRSDLEALRAQAEAGRDRLRTILADQLARIDRLSDVVAPLAPAGEPFASSPAVLTPSLPPTSLPPTSPLPPSLPAPSFPSPPSTVSLFPSASSSGSTSGSTVVTDGSALVNALHGVPSSPDSRALSDSVLSDSVLSDSVLSDSGVSDAVALAVDRPAKVLEAQTGADFMS